MTALATGAFCCRCVGGVVLLMREGGRRACLSHTNSFTPCARAHSLSPHWNRIDGGGETAFVCERVCTSPRLLRRMGGLSKVRGGRGCRRAGYRPGSMRDRAADDRQLTWMGIESVGKGDAGGSRPSKNLLLRARCWRRPTATLSLSVRLSPCSRHTPTPTWTGPHPQHMRHRLRHLLRRRVRGSLPARRVRQPAPGPRLE